MLLWVFTNIFVNGAENCKYLTFIIIIVLFTRLSGQQYIWAGCNAIYSLYGIYWNDFHELVVALWRYILQQNFIIGTGNGLSPVRYQAIAFMGNCTLKTPFVETLIKFSFFSFKNIYLEMSAIYWRFLSGSEWVNSLIYWGCKWWCCGICMLRHFNITESGRGRLLDPSHKSHNP